MVRTAKAKKARVIHFKGNTPKSVKVIAIVVVLVVAVHVWIDRLYALRLHAALGYGSVYSLNMTIELATRYGGALVYAVLLLWLVRPFAKVLPLAFYRVLRIPIGVLGWTLGYLLWSLNPTKWILFFSHPLVHRVDPLLHMDLSFYIYELPLYNGLVARILFTAFVILMVQVFYTLALWIKQQGLTQGPRLQAELQSAARRDLWLISVIFIGFAALSWLGRYDLMLTGGNGSFLYGPGFVDAHLTLPFFSWLHIALLLVTAASFAWIAAKGRTFLPVRDGFVTLDAKVLRRPLWAFGVYVLSMAVTAAVGGLVSTLYVHPNQNTVELPFIKNTIDATRWALGIQGVQTKSFVPQTTLTRAAVNRDQAGLTNVRVNDQGQTTAIYNQLQSFKSYFHFDHASVDRYGSSEVYVAARQMNVDNLPVKTWINQTLVYTHGYGLAASPVNQFDANGLPVLWASNTPQQTQPPLPQVTRPQIYFGTMSNDVIAPSKQAEFDYPVASADQTSHYQGGYGLPVVGNRWLLALQQRSLKFFTSDQITSKSLWLFDRNIYQRVQDIAPFLRYDQDAFPFIDSQGHIKWMLDAYTTSSSIPYAQSFLNTQYIRNSVKVVMDAYTGKVTFYVIDPKDPLLQGLMHAYPTLFTTKIPADIQAHFRYPSDLFLAQAQGLTRYHMTNPSAFYNQEDLWSIANQIYQQNQTSPRPPVYQMIRMPDRTKAQFVLTELFTPANKDNLNGWMIADNDPGQYGKLTVYQFPQSNLIFGPMQAENQIDSNPSISEQLTLWNQQGSHVVRGDLLLVPVGNALLYIEPVYLVANRQNSLPQLERVIIDFNQQVFIDDSLGAAINDLLNGPNGNTLQPNAPSQVGANPPGGAGQGSAGQGSAGQVSAGQGGSAQGGSAQGGVAGQSQQTLIARANELFKQYKTDTSQGNFTAAGNDLNQLQQVLAQLLRAGQSAGSGSGQPSLASQ